MFWNSLKLALRIFWRQRVYTFINILGLSIGIACFIVILSYAKNELSYDKHHQSPENIYRLTLKGEMSGTFFEAAVTGGPVATIVHEELPEIIRYTRLMDFPQTVLFEVGEKKLYEDKLIYADSLFFDVFTYPFKFGSPEVALDNPYSLVLTESIAKKYFGDENPVGKIIRWNNDMDYTVQAVLKEPLPNSHISFDILVSRASLYNHPRYNNVYNSLFAFTNISYVVFDRSYPYADIDEKVKNTILNYMADDLAETNSKIEIHLQPIIDIHLNSNLMHEIEQNGNKSVVYIFIAIAFLIIIISGINYVNLSVACSTNRALEVGVRKVFGGTKQSLFVLFVCESILLTFISFELALAIIEFVRPIFNNLTDKGFNIILYQGVYYWLFLLLFVPILGLLAGSYPSLFLARQKPVTILKGKSFKSGKRSYFRDSMIVVQFIISIFLICSSWLIIDQINYIEKKDIGFKKDNLIVAALRDGQMRSQYEALKNELVNIPGVKDVTSSSQYLGKLSQRRGFYKDGYGRTDMMMLLNLQVDHNYFDVMEMEFIAGRSFRPEPDADQNTIIINESLANELSLENPVGKYLNLPSGETEADDQKLEILGVVKDFHFASLHNEVKPILVWKDVRQSRFINIRIDGSNSQASLNMIQEKWAAFFPDNPFDYFYLEDKYNNLYKADFKASNVFTSFTFIALFIAALGLFGLTSYITEKRTKEIGIRKVMGSGIKQIMGLFSKQFTWLIIIASVLTIPFAYFMMNKWLDNFAYKVAINWIIFIASPIIALIISLITINIRTFIAARKNPVDAIRYE